MPEVYFDNAATTQVDEAIIAQMADVMRSEYGNPSSLHSRGVAAEKRLSTASRQVMSALGAKGGGSDAMIQGSVNATREALTAFINDYFKGECL